MYWSGAGAGSSSGSDNGSLANDPIISAQYTGGSGIGGITPLVYNPESDGPPVFHSGVFTGDHGSVQFVQTADSGNQGTGEGDASESDDKSRARSWWGIQGWFLGDEPIDDGGTQVVQVADTGADGDSTSESDGSLIATMGDLADDAGSYVSRSSKSLILGDWTDEKPTGLSIGTGIGLGVLGVDLPMDVRDLSHTLTHREWSYEWGETLAFNTIGLIPLIGVLKNLKNAKKLKYLDDAGELAKRSDDAADAAGDAGRRAPPASDPPSDPPPKGPSGPPSDPPKGPSDPSPDTPYPNDNGLFPADPNDFTKQLGVPPFKVTTTKDGTIRMIWEPNSNTRIRFESHPDGLKPGDPGFNPRHHGEHFHVEIKPDGMTWGQAERRGLIEKSRPDGYTPGSGTGFLPNEPFPGQ